jgi:hypothetical protein
MADNEASGERKFPPNAVHLIRTTQQAHYTLSQMADQKASILMGATFVVFTLTISQARTSAAPIALLVLGGFAFCAAILAILSILPATSTKKTSWVNVLFFGSFTQLDEEAFVERILDSMTSDETVYRTMAHDIWQNGRVLARKKYRLLGYAYRVFLAGITASLITFIVEWAVA